MLLEKKIIIIASEERVHPALPVYASHIADEFKRLGYKVLYLDMNTENYYNAELSNSQIINFCNIPNIPVLCFNINKHAFQILWDMYKCHIYEVLLDHPWNFHKDLFFMKKITFLCLDRHHVQYINRFYKANAIFFPIPGIKAEHTIPFSQRKIDVLFSGNLQEVKNIEYIKNQINNAEDAPSIKQLLLDIATDCWLLMESNNYYSCDEALEAAIIKKGLRLSYNELDAVNRALRMLDAYNNRNNRLRVIQTLSDNDIHVHIFGDTERIKSPMKNAVYLKGRNYLESIELAGQAKILLNVMPNYKDGTHDRVYNAMLNGAVSLTERTPFLSETLEDSKNVIMFSLSELDELPDKIKYYLAHPKILEEIAENGYEYAKEIHTWANMAKWLDDIIESDVNRAEINNNELIITPVYRHKTLDERFEGWAVEKSELTDDDKEWLHMKPTGEEFEL